MTHGWLIALRLDPPAGPVGFGWYPTRAEALHWYHENPGAHLIAVCRGTLEEYEQHRAELAPHRFRPETN